MESDGGRGGGRGSSPGLIIAHVRSHSWAIIIFVRGQLHLFMGAGVHSWVVMFILEQSHLFLSICVCLWAVVTLVMCGGGGPLVGGDSGCSSWLFICMVVGCCGLLL